MWIGSASPEEIKIPMTKFGDGAKYTSALRFYQIHTSSTDSSARLVVQMIVDLLEAGKRMLHLGTRRQDNAFDIGR
jgi:hypothetical protein